jgi:hypothetical protein
MGWRRQTPEEGHARDRWRFDNGEPGKPWSGWLAGRCEWFLCHYDPRSRPCPRCFTEGALQCSRCKSGWVPYWFGYCPIFRELDGRAVMVGLHESSFDTVRSIRRFDSVKVFPSADKSQGVGLVAGALPRYQTCRPDRVPLPNLFPFLWRMWKMPDLEAWWSNNIEGVDDGRDSLAGGAPGVLGGGDRGPGVSPVGGGEDVLPPEVVREVMRQRAERERRTNLPPVLGENLNGRATHAHGD